MAAAIRTLTRGRSRLHTFGVEGYAHARGGDELFALIDGQRPAAVLMESYVVPSGHVAVGAAVPYRSHLNPLGLERACAMLEDHAFREKLSCEAVGVLAAMRVSAEVRFADRQHTLSFDKIVERLSMDALREVIIEATEAFAASLESQPSGESRPPQNVLCQFFPELWNERHTVMARVVQQTLDQCGGDVALVVGAEHVEPVVEQLDRLPDAGFAGFDPDFDALLREPLMLQSRQEEMEKRAALGALLVSTHTFPPEIVLQPAEEMEPESKEIVRKVYPKYRWAIDSRLNSVGSGQRSAYARLAEMMQGKQSVAGLGRLEELCNDLAE